LLQGADRNRLTGDGETALNLVDEDDIKTLAVLMNTKEEVEKERRQSVVKDKQEKREPAWVRSESVQDRGGGAF
jgi:molybdenum cofactor biosynthesis enzyme MoaA